jgi:hypothetical protein
LPVRKARGNGYTGALNRFIGACKLRRYTNGLHEKDVGIGTVLRGMNIKRGARASSSVSIEWKKPLAKSIHRVYSVPVIGTMFHFVKHHF